MTDDLKNSVRTALEEAEDEIGAEEVPPTEVGNILRSIFQGSVFGNVTVSAGKETGNGRKLGRRNVGPRGKKYEICVRQEEDGGGIAVFYRSV